MSGDGIEINVTKVTAPVDNPLSQGDVTFHLEPAAPPGWSEAFMEAWQGGGMPVPLPEARVSRSSITVVEVTLEYVRNYRIAAAVKLAVERAGPIYAKQVLAKQKQERQRIEEAHQRRAETDRLLAEINEQITDSDE